MQIVVSSARTVTFTLNSLGDTLRVCCSSTVGAKTVEGTDVQSETNNECRLDKILELPRPVSRSHRICRASRPTRRGSPRRRRRPGRRERKRAKMIKILSVFLCFQVFGKMCAPGRWTRTLARRRRGTLPARTGAEPDTRTRPRRRSSPGGRRRRWKDIVRGENDFGMLGYVEERHS